MHGLRLVQAAVCDPSATSGATRLRSLGLQDNQIDWSIDAEGAVYLEQILRGAPQSLTSLNVLVMGLQVHSPPAHLPPWLAFASLVSSSPRL